MDGVALDQKHRAIMLKASQDFVDAVEDDVWRHASHEERIRLLMLSAGITDAEAERLRHFRPKRSQTWIACQLAFMAWHAY